MKTIILLPAFMFCLASGLWAGVERSDTIQEQDDCSKSAGACKPRIQKLTPFMAELKKAEKPSELKQGESKARLAAVSTAVTAAKVAGNDTAGAAPAGPQFVSHFGTPTAEPPAQKEALSKPAWLLAVGALLAGLYYFLKEGKSKRKRA